MSLFQKIRGTTESLFQYSLGGPQIKNSSGALEGRNAADSAYAVVRGATPVASNDLATKAYADTLSAAASIKVIRFALALATVSSATSIPASSRVLSARLEITTAYDAGATWSLGRTGSTSLIMATTDNDPATINAYQNEQDTGWGGSALPVLATLTGSPTVGVAVVVVEYVETPNA